MTYYDAIILGAIQGITEWLPISSSGHLAAYSAATGFTENITFDVVLHLATLVVVLYFFRKKIIDIVATRDLKYILQITGATIPVAIAGVLFEESIDHIFGSLSMIGVIFAINGCLLMSTKWMKKQSNTLTAKNTLVVGLAQVLALLPGISRSGITLLAAYVQGVDHKKAAEFSFLLGIPTILGAFVLKFDELSVLSELELGPYIVGCLVAVVCGYASLAGLMWIVEKAKLHYFAAYAWIAALIITYIAHIS